MVWAFSGALVSIINLLFVGRLPLPTLVFWVALLPCSCGIAGASCQMPLLIGFDSSGLERNISARGSAGFRKRRGCYSHGSLVWSHRRGLGLRSLLGLGLFFRLVMGSKEFLPIFFSDSASDSAVAAHSADDFSERKHQVHRL
jgi:hypothetical protein